ncbi:dihydroneopterin aldolase [Bacteroidales bacterium OttesenSCG-928-I14]|nr:dihydroneopterin aldolase [Bacteroidales bacterium OttesenSCG-928-I14]
MIYKKQIINLTQMNFFAFHGVMEQEKKVGNVFTVDLSLHLDLSAAVESDDLNDTINYATIYEIVKQEMETASNLLEHLAGRIIKAIKANFPQIEGIEITLAKRRPPFAADIKEASVTLVV